MTRWGTKPGIGLLVGLLSVATFMAAPASARAHHHNHHHHHGGGITCGPGTVSSGGTCVPTGPAGPVGNSNVVLTPSNVTMTVNGTFGSSVVVSGLPPTIGVTSNTGIQCGNGATITIVTNTGSTDALGRIGAEVYNTTSPPGCVPGTYPIILTEGSSPFQTFTGFITLHF